MPCPAMKALDLIPHRWQCRLWGPWVCVLPWGLKVSLWNWCFLRKVDWRLHGSYWHWSWG